MLSLVIWGLIFLQTAFSADKANDSRDPASAWIELFNGKDLDGWIQRGGKARYRVENGCVVGTSVTNTGNSFLCTRRDFTNFVLELDFRVATGVNSGVQVRSHCFTNATELNWKGRQIRVPAGRVHGLQAEIDTSARAWTAGLYDEGRRGWLNDLKENEAARKAFKAGEWNQLRVQCEGSRVRTWLNGVSAADLQDDLSPAGFIGLQVHSVGKNGTPGHEISFKNLRLREL
jgi:hypothetical protein